jgi:hypothetical protein
VPLAGYAGAWVEERPLSPTTRERYEFALRFACLPILGSYPLVDISEAAVRRWRKALIDAGTGTATVAKAYRTLRAILNTAVDDGLIRRNPCRIKGAGHDKAPERPITSLDDIFRLADAIGPRYRALVLLATFASFALRRASRSPPKHATSERDRLIADALNGLFGFWRGLRVHWTTMEPRTRQLGLPA